MIDYIPVLIVSHYYMSEYPVLRPFEEPTHVQPIIPTLRNFKPKLHQHLYFLASALWRESVVQPLSNPLHLLLIQKWTQETEYFLVRRGGFI